MRNLLICALLSVVLLATVAVADTFVVQLPWASGDYDRSNGIDLDPVSGTFDFGTSFASIDNIYIRWSGWLHPGLVAYDDRNNVLATERYFSEVLDPVLIAEILDPMPGAPDSLNRARAYEGGSQFSSSTFDTTSVFDNTPDPHPWMPWSTVLSGKGTIVVGTNSPISWLGHGVTTVVSPLVQLEHAELVLVGAAVPEPPAMAVLALGLGAAVVGLRRVRGRQ
jgi:hypothetical protein